MLPCRYCLVPLAAAGDVDGALPYLESLRTATWNEEKRAAIVRDTFHNATQLEKRLKELSLSAGPIGGLSGIPFGCGGQGVNGAAALDMLHQYLLGIMKRTWKNFKKLMNLHKTNVRKREGALEQRFAMFNYRHSGWCKSVA